MQSIKFKPKKRMKTAADTSEELRAELNASLSNPGQIFGYAHYGPRWPKLNEITAGIQKNNMYALASRPKRGKSMLTAAWVPEVAFQAMVEDEVVRIVSLEMRRMSYQRRMAAIMAGIDSPMRIRQGLLLPDEVARYSRALDNLASLPIEYLTNEVDLDEDEAMVDGNSPVTFDEMSDFIHGRSDPDGRKTFWWVLDHIGLLNDLANGDMTTSIANLANKLQKLTRQTSAGLVITHLTRASVGAKPSIESIAGSDQVGRNADGIYLLSRPFMDKPELDEEEKALTADVEPAFLQIYSRDETSGCIDMLWNHHTASFMEISNEDV